MAEKGQSQFSQDQTLRSSFSASAIRTNSIVACRQVSGSTVLSAAAEEGRAFSPDFMSSAPCLLAAIDGEG